jgi:hypothetical protein
MEHMDKHHLVVTEDLLMTLTELEYVKIEWGFKALLTKLLFSDFFLKLQWPLSITPPIEETLASRNI